MAVRQPTGWTSRSLWRTRARERVYRPVCCILGVLPVELESPLPASLPAGSRVALYCSGTASEDGRAVAGLRLLVDGRSHRPSAVAAPRPDTPCRRSGFWGVVPVMAGSAGTEVTLAAEVSLAGGGRRTVELGRIPVTAPAGQTGRDPAPATGGRAPLIAICMGTFNPPPGLLERQLESIRRQSDEDWTCVISDDHSDEAQFEVLREAVAGDPRFTISRSPVRIGFYRNFERALGLIPREAALVALCDQDDIWHPDKLATLRDSLEDAALVYSDQRLVDSDGAVLRDTMWSGRANNFGNLASMLVANTVTGAASLLRREVAEHSLPFPDSPGIEFHDHWIGLVALASGDIRYVERPLYDYVQHRGAVLGKVARAGRGGPHRLGRAARGHWRAAYFLGYVPGAVRARTLLLRFGEQMPAGKRRALGRYLAAEHSLVGLVWMLARPLRALWGHTETLGTEWELARGILWKRAALAVSHLPWPGRLAPDTRFPNPPHFEQRRMQRWRSRV